MQSRLTEILNYGELAIGYWRRINRRGRRGKEIDRADLRFQISVSHILCDPLRPLR